MRVIVLSWLFVFFTMMVPCHAFGPDESKWSISYPVPEGVKAVTVTLAYRYWDPKVDGDVASKKVLLTEHVTLGSGQKSVPVQILLNGGKSVVVVGKQAFKGRGRLLDESFARAKEPKTNPDGFYVLAQKPVDPKKPAAIGDVQNADAWVELGIDPQP